MGLDTTEQKILEVDTSLINELVWGGELESVNLSSGIYIFFLQDFSRATNSIKRYLQAPLEKVR